MDVSPLRRLLAELKRRLREDRRAWHHLYRTIQRQVATGTA